MSCRSGGNGCVQCEGNAASCQGNTSRVCSNNVFTSESCANGCNPGNGRCNALLPQGATGCQGAQQCAGSGSACIGGRCCEFDCSALDMTCGQQGQCECDDNRVRQGNLCLLRNGESCVAGQGSSCLSGQCSRFFPDADGDGFGNEDQASFFCGGIPPNGFIVQGRDCCDSDANVFSGQSGRFSVPTACGGFDYDCDGGITTSFQEDTELALRLGCTGATAELCPGAFWSLTTGTPPCGGTGSITICSFSAIGPPGTLPRCQGVSGQGNITNSCR